MRRHLILLVVATLLAGCTGLGGGSDTGDGGGAHGFTIHDATLADTEIRPGEQTELVVRLENAHPSAVENVNIHLSNLGTLSPSLDAASDGSSRDSGQNCRFDSIRAATPAAPTNVMCVWTLSAPGSMDGDTAQTYPVTVTASYDATLSMQSGTLKFSFDDAVTSDESRTVSTSFSNAEISISASHPHTVRTGASTIPLDVTVQNSGAGDIQRRDGSRYVDLSYSGTMTGLFAVNHCDRANFIAGEQATTLECTLEKQGGASVTAGTTRSLQMTADYRYQRHKELSLAVRP